MDIAADAATVIVRRPKETKKMVRYGEALRAQLNVRIDGTNIMPSSTERKTRPQDQTLLGWIE